MDSAGAVYRQNNMAYGFANFKLEITTTSKISDSSNRVVKDYYDAWGKHTKSQATVGRGAIWGRTFFGIYFLTQTIFYDILCLR